MGTLITERGINYHFYPVTKSRGRKLEEDYIKKRKDKIIFISKKGCIWDYNCYCLMDYFASEYKVGFDKFCISRGGLVKTSYDPRLSEFLFINRPDYIVNLQRELETPGYHPELRNLYCKTFTRTSREMLKHPCLKHMDSKTLISTIEKVSLFMVKTNFEILSEGNTKIGNDVLIRDFSKSFNGISDSGFFNIFNIKSKILKVGKNKKVYNTEYKFSFDTVIGALFIHNISCKGYHLIDDRFYSISKNANLLYRKRFIVLRNMSTILRMDTVLSDLCLTNKNFSESKKKFISIVEELADSNLINVKKFKSDGKIIRYKAVTSNKKSNKNKVIKFKQKNEQNQLV